VTREVNNKLYSKRKKKQSRKRFLRIILSLVLIIFWFISSYSAFLIMSVGSTITGAYLEIDNDQNLREAPLELGVDSFSLLVLGIEREDLETPGYADAILLMTVNQESEATNILSLSRDLRVDFTGHGIQYNHLGFRYTVGGAPAVVELLQRMLNLPIDYVVVIDMTGFAILIDEVDGITVDNELEFAHGGYHFPTGLIDLHGSKALSYVRMRMDDPDSDFGRQRRQRNVAAETLRSLTEPRIALSRHNDILAILGDNVQTNLTTTELITIFWNYRDALAGDIELLERRGTRVLINDVYFHIKSDEEVLEMSEKLRELLGLDD